LEPNTCHQFPQVKADVVARTPAFRVPGDLVSVPIVALAYDETEGLMFLANFVLVREAFPHRREARVAAALEYLTTFAVAGAAAHRDHRTPGPGR